STQPAHDAGSPSDGGVRRRRTRPFGLHDEGLCQLQGAALESPASLPRRAARHSPAQSRREIRNFLCRSSDRCNRFARPRKCQLCLRTGVSYVPGLNTALAMTKYVGRLVPATTVIASVAKQSRNVGQATGLGCCGASVPNAANGSAACSLWLHHALAGIRALAALAGL